IADTGTGMTRDTLARIFEPFFTTKPVGQGTGLGLSVVEGLLDQSGGYAAVTSAPGAGTTFSLYFPLVPDAAELAERTRPVDVSRSTLSGATVLVVDDEPSV